MQRVSFAEVLVKGRAVGKINSGCLVLLGVGRDDDKLKSGKLAEKISKLRIFKDSEGKMNNSLLDSGESCLVVSQFTLYADTKKGNRPSFIKAALPEKAEPLYKHFVSELRDKGIKTETGQFGSYMEIKANLDGPVTISLEI